VAITLEEDVGEVLTKRKKMFEDLDMSIRCLNVEKATPLAFLRKANFVNSDVDLTTIRIG
jgi:hypothetical protein